MFRLSHHLRKKYEEDGHDLRENDSEGHCAFRHAVASDCKRWPWRLMNTSLSAPMHYEQKTPKCFVISSTKRSRF